MSFDYIVSGAPAIPTPAAPSSCFDQADGVVYNTLAGTGWVSGLIPTQDTISAAGTTQATATVLPLKNAYNVTVAAASSGVLLPKSVTGMVITVANNGANTLDIYPNSGDKVNALAVNAAFSAATGALTIFYCFTSGQWFTK